MWPSVRQTHPRRPSVRKTQPRPHWGARAGPPSRRRARAGREPRREHPAVSPAATRGTVRPPSPPAAISPGPNFVLIAHTAAAGSRKAALAVALGVVAAGGVLAAVAVFGLGTVLAHHPWLATA